MDVMEITGLLLIFYYYYCDPLVRCEQKIISRAMRLSATPYRTELDARTTLSSSLPSPLLAAAEARGTRLMKNPPANWYADA